MDIIDNIKETLTWWERFYKVNHEKEDLAKIFKMIEQTDDDTTEVSLKKLKNMVNELDKVKYKKEIENFNRKIKIFEKRLERQVDEDFGLMLKRLREQKGFSLSKVEEMTGISASYINRIELGQRKAPSYPIIEKIAAALNVSAHSLFDVAGKEQDPLSITELLYSNDIFITEDKEPITSSTKEQLIEIINFIINMKWKDNKHIEMIKLIELLDEFK